MCATAVDEGPWPCDEDGCPSSSVTCDDLEPSCIQRFDEVFLHVPSADLEHVKISTRCAFTCGGCAPPGNASGVAVGGDDGASARERARRAARDAGLAPCADGEPCLDAYGVARGVEHPRSLMVAATSMLKPASATPKNVAHGPPPPPCKKPSKYYARCKTEEKAAERREAQSVQELSTYTGYLKRFDGKHRKNYEFEKLPHYLPGRCRVFKVGNREDFVKSVRPALVQLGLCEARGTEEWHIQWGRVWQHPKAPFLNASIPEGAIVNSVPGMFAALGEKTSLPRLQVHCFEHFGFDPLAPLPTDVKDCRFTMRGFNVLREGDRMKVAYKRFREYNLAAVERGEHGGSGATAHKIWIAKPQGGFNQVGIHMFNFFPSQDAESDGATEAWLRKHIAEGHWILQEYEMHPLLYKGHKFDVRAWGLLTSLDPLRVYMLRHGVPKISQFPYTDAPDQTKEQCIHVLMPGTDDCFARGEPIDPYPPSTTDPNFIPHLGVVRGADGITRKCDENCWWSTVWAAAEWRLVEMLLLARERVIKYDVGIRAAGLRYKRVMVLQPDFVFDRSGNAYMVECNSNGYMIGDLHKDFFSLQRETVALLELVGANGYPRQAEYAKALNRHLDDFCDREDEDCGGHEDEDEDDEDEDDAEDDAKLELAEMVHETQHASLGWSRVFPAGDEKAHVAHFKRSAGWAKLLTELDMLNLRWLAYKQQLWARRQKKEEVDETPRDAPD